MSFSAGVPIAGQAQNKHPARVLDPNTIPVPPNGTNLGDDYTDANLILCGSNNLHPSAAGHGPCTYNAAENVEKMTRASKSGELAVLDRLVELSKDVATTPISTAISAAGSGSGNNAAPEWLSELCRSHGRDSCPATSDVARQHCEGHHGCRLGGKSAAMAAVQQTTPRPPRWDRLFCGRDSPQNEHRTFLFDSEIGDEENNCPNGIQQYWLADGFDLRSGNYNRGDLDLACSQVADNEGYFTCEAADLDDWDGDPSFL